MLITQGRLWNAPVGSARAAAERPRERSFSIDTRTLQPGQIFIALRGAQSDGHDYLGQAVEKGAGGLMVSDSKQISEIALRNAPFVIHVTDTLRALHAIARACRQKHAIPLAGVTGSNGKTTVKDMAAAILAIRRPVLKSPKSFNNPIGLPLTLANMTAQQEVAVLEMGMNAPGEIRQLAALARPDVGVITNIAPAHFGFFPSLEAIMRAKLELFEALPVQGTAVLNADDALFDKMLEHVPCAVFTFGAKPGRHGDRYPLIFPENLTLAPDASYAFELHTPNGQILVQLRLPGYHNVLNALAAAAAAVALHCSELAAIKAGLEHFQPSPMRMQVTTQHEVTLINDAYNANPVSMAAALRTLQSFPCAGRKIAVLGDMRELGPISSSAHYHVGELAAEVPVSRLFLLGEYAPDIAQGAQAAGLAAAQICIGASHAELAAELAHYVQPRDLLLFKASRGMTLEKVIDDFLKKWKVEDF